MRVLAPRVDDDLDPGKVRRRLHDQVGRRSRNRGGNFDELEARTCVRVDRCVDIGRGDANHCCEPGDDCGPSGERQVGRPDLHGINGNVGDEWAARSVIDEAPRRWKGLHDCRPGRHRRYEPGAVRALEVEQPRAEDADADQDSESERDESRPGADEVHRVVVRGHP